MKCKDDSYFRLIQLIDNCVTEVTYTEVAQCKKILVIAVNVETRVKRFMEALEKENPQIELIFIAQPIMAETIKNEYDERYSVISWQGKYSCDVLDKVEVICDLKELDAFAFFSDQPINLRDINFMDIAEQLQSYKDVRVFANIISEEVCEYKKIAVYSRAMKMYQNINDLIDAYFTAKDMCEEGPK